MTSPGGAPSPVRVSVVVPVFNAERHLEACLAGLRSQSFPSDAYEIILVDNGSTDGSLRIAAQGSRVRLFREARPGPYAARNRGVSQARGSVIAFTDADCVADEDWLHHLAAALARPETGVVLGSRRPAGPSLLARMLAGYEDAKVASVLASGDPDLCYGYTNNMGVRRELFERLGPFVETPRGADTIFVSRVAHERSCGAIRFCPDAMVTHRELDGFRSYCRKVFLYGRYRARNRLLARTRTLGLRQRLAIARDAIRAGGYGQLRGILLRGVLAAALVAWQAGFWTAALGGGLRRAILREKTKRGGEVPAPGD